MCGPAFTFTRVFSRSSIVFAGFRHVRVGRQVVLLAADLREEHALAVDRDLELVRELEPGHVADDVAQQQDAELVLGVLREVVRKQQAAARAERQPVDVILLRIVRRNAIGRRESGRVSVPTARLLILPRGAEVLLEQRRRDAQHAGDVVEPVALVVGRQQVA